MKKVLMGWLLCVAAVQAQEIVRYDFQNMAGRKDTVEAVIRVPSGDAPRKALILLHHAGGWGEGTTRQYAEYFAERGFVTLEPRMFNVRPRRSSDYLGEVFGALKYLAAHPAVDKTQISVMGLSLGANLAIFSATQWAQDKFGDAGLRFKSLAAFYPVCWPHTATIQRTLPGRFKHSTVPEDFEDKWAAIALRLFVGTLDDYDDRDPQACPDFIAAIPDAKQRSLTSLVQYPGATHGWDQQTRSFPEHVACKGRGCTNHNVHNPEVTAKAKEDLLKYLSE